MALVLVVTNNTKRNKKYIKKRDKSLTRGIIKERLHRMLCKKCKNTNQKKNELFDDGMNQKCVNERHETTHLRNIKWGMVQ